MAACSAAESSAIPVRSVPQRQDFAIVVAPGQRRRRIAPHGAFAQPGSSLAYVSTRQRVASARTLRNQLQETAFLVWGVGGYDLHVNVAPAVPLLEEQTLLGATSHVCVMMQYKQFDQCHKQYKQFDQCHKRYKQHDKS
eukprot:49825-Rhodomonas_salina.2